VQGAARFSLRSFAIPRIRFLERVRIHGDGGVEFILVNRNPRILLLAIRVMRIALWPLTKSSSLAGECEKVDPNQRRRGIRGASLIRNLPSDEPSRMKAKSILRLVEETIECAARQSRLEATKRWR
jgi:hypothetical protein